MKIRDEIKWLIPLVLVCFVVFANTVGGEFVYDDTRQIVRNTLIQDNSLIWKALTSDVWAFKGDGTQAASNYWRPTFTLWNILCYRLFGMSPAGWHVANILLHTGVSVMAFLLLRKWQFAAMVAFAIALVFAVHPVHVESVAWIAGSPDLLFSLALLGSLWFATSYRESRSTNHLILTVLLYAFALGAKEVGILCLPIYYFVLRDGEAETKKTDNNTPLLILGAVAVVYFLARYAVIGAIARPPDDAVALGDSVMSVPMMFAFYVRQIFAPIWVAINYPITPVTQVGAMNFIVPLVVSLATLAGVFFLARSSNKNRIGAAIFLLPLIPAMNATAFISEQIVHDRYLYLPLLGVLMLLVPFAANYVTERNVLIAGCLIAAALSVQTFMYNAAYAKELSLWQWTQKVDDSAFTSMQLGNALTDAERTDESIAAYTAAIEKKPVFRGYLGRGRAYLASKQYQNAERDLKTAISLPKEMQEAYALYQAYEALGIAYAEQRKYDDAIRMFREGRRELPIYAAALAEKLGIVLYQANQKELALHELEMAVQQARLELLPESKNVLFRLGMLYGELGRKVEARNALNEYLRSTASFSDKNTIANRSQAARIVESLK
jgi:protein O-mannosyl-transferase